jgi:hypothetical protein
VEGHNPVAHITDKTPNITLQHRNIRATTDTSSS